MTVNWPDAPAVLPEHRADVETYGRERFMDVDKSIRLYEQLGRPGGDWQAWEWPRRLAALERGPGETRTPLPTRTSPDNGVRPTPRPIVDVPVQLDLLGAA